MQRPDFVQGRQKRLLITENKFFGAKKTFINKTTVDHYELVMQEGNSSMGSGVARGAVGAALFGGISAIAGANSAKKNSDYTVSIIFKDGTKALCSLDADNYKALVRIMY